MRTSTENFLSQTLGIYKFSSYENNYGDSSTQLLHWKNSDYIYINLFFY